MCGWRGLVCRDGPWNILSVFFACSSRSCRFGSDLLLRLKRPCRPGSPDPLQLSARPPDAVTVMSSVADPRRGYTCGLLEQSQASHTMTHNARCISKKRDGYLGGRITGGEGTVSLSILSESVSSLSNVRPIKAMSMSQSGPTDYQGRPCTRNSLTPGSHRMLAGLPSRIVDRSRFRHRPRYVEPQPWARQLSTMRVLRGNAWHKDRSPYSETLAFVRMTKRHSFMCGSLNGRRT
jgi:hypothetical protein